mmetsp:Transcript_31045/g.50224  ORF Transcript_31045/g.50224 Transcript_31045/m.50224 type:complete len:438 (-) Transcript_31045:1024-2337(-)
MTIHYGASINICLDDLTKQTERPISITAAMRRSVSIPVVVLHGNHEQNGQVTNDAPKWASMATNRVDDEEPERECSQVDLLLPLPSSTIAQTSSGVLCEVEAERLQEDDHEQEVPCLVRPSSPMAVVPSLPTQIQAQTQPQPPAQPHGYYFAPPQLPAALDEQFMQWLYLPANLTSSFPFPPPSLPAALRSIEDALMPLDLLLMAPGTIMSSSFASSMGINARLPPPPPPPFPPLGLDWGEDEANLDTDTDTVPTLTASDEEQIEETASDFVYAMGHGHLFDDEFVPAFDDPPRQPPRRHLLRRNMTIHSRHRSTSLSSTSTSATQSFSCLSHRLCHTLQISRPKPQHFRSPMSGKDFHNKQSRFISRKYLHYVRTKERRPWSRARLELQKHTLAWQLAVLQRDAQEALGRAMVLRNAADSLLRKIAQSPELCAALL